MNTPELDEKILSELRKTGYVRRKDLLEDLKAKYADEIGFSFSSINRRISELHRDHIIQVIDSSEFASYGISDEDKRAKYLVLSSYAEKKTLVDNLIAKASDGDPFEKYLVIKEIRRNLDEYSLNWSQLAHLSECLNPADERTDALVIEIIHDSLLKQRSCIGEEEQDSLLGNIYDSLVEYRVPLMNENKRLLLDILGFFSAETVIEALKVDLEDAIKDTQGLPKEDRIPTKSWVKELYHSKYLVHAFEIYNTDLFRLMWGYNEKGKREGHEDEREIALIVDDILDYAAENKRKAIYYDPHSCGVRK